MSSFKWYDWGVFFFFVPVMLWLLVIIGVLLYHSDECEDFGYRTAVTSGVKFWDIRCIDPIEYHRSKSLQELREGN